MGTYKTLLGLYPTDIRVWYGDEMVGDYDIGLADARRRGQIALVRFVACQQISQSSIINSRLPAWRATRSQLWADR